jgi:hypothetical protein
VKIAVVGAGLYGCTAAIKLAHAGHEVNLFERYSDILQGATAASCNRIHLGYHYPRSVDTALTAITDTPGFIKEFRTSVYSGAWHHYVIAGGGSVSREQFTDFMHKLALPYDACEGNLVRGAVTEDVVLVPELLLNVNRLRTDLTKRLADAHVNLHVSSPGTSSMRGHDVTVMTTYGRDFPRPLQYEVTEVAIMHFDDAFRHNSFVIIDGPFACVDPLPDTNLHLLYDVTHSVHHRNVGMTPEVPEHLRSLIDRGPVITPHTHVRGMLDTLGRYLRDTRDAVHVGSLFTVRAVLPDVDDTDERPTLVGWSGDTVHVLSGKISSAMAAADRVLIEIEERK